MKILIFGFKSAGKTTFGKLISSQLNLPFYDLDELILKEFETHTSIRTLFYTLGEVRFRQIESEILLKLLEIEQGVVSLGGGSLDSIANLNLLKSFPIRIYLNLEFSELAKRVGLEVDYPYRHSLLEIYQERGKKFEELQTLEVKISNQPIWEILKAIFLKIYG